MHILAHQVPGIAFFLLALLLFWLADKDNALGMSVIGFILIVLAILLVF